MRVERIIKGIQTLGPGKRLVIWTNGCNKRCKGCVSERLQEIDEHSSIDIMKTLNEFTFHNVDGVTISGGEPFIQVSELKKVVEFLVGQKISDILIYTGYLYEELLELNDSDINYILENIAVLIDGEYIEELNDNTSNLKGSSNQKIIYLKKEVEEKYLEYMSKHRQMETYYIQNLKIGVGIPTDEYIDKF